MEDVLNNPTVGDNQAKIDAAFGTNAGLDLKKVKQTVQRMKNDVLPIQSAKPGNYEGPAEVPYHKIKNGVAKPNPETGKIFNPALIGTKFYAQQPDDQANTLIHEAAHYQSLAGDHVDKSGPVDRVFRADELPREGSFAKNQGCE